MKQTTHPFLVLVDGSSYLYRAFHALPALTNSAGESTGALYGVINMLRRLLKECQPEKMAVIFDAKGKTFRHELYEPYKANRPAMPDELAQQIEPLHAVIRAMGIPLLLMPGVEADDVIGTLARQAEADQQDTLVSTGDKDLAQLVSTNITLINTMTGAVMTPDAVKEKFGVSPGQMTDWLTLVGDTSDNVPGVPMVGPKTAAKWLAEFGTLDRLVAQADTISGKAGVNLRASLSALPLSRQLVTIRTDLSLSVHYGELQCQPPDAAKLTELFRRYEFNSWLKELSNNTPVASQDSLASYTVIDTEKKLDEWIEKLSAAPFFALDTETTSLDVTQAQLVGLAFADRPGSAAYLPLRHTDETVTQLPVALALEKLRPLLENPHVKKIGHHFKYDMTVLARAGIAVQGIAWDTLLESGVLDSGNSRHDMDTLARKHLGRETIRFEDVAGKGAKQVTFDQVPVAAAAQYAAEDADVTLQLHGVLWPRLEQHPSLKTVFCEIEMPLLPVLARMEQTGVRVDAALLAQQTLALEKKLQEAEQQAFLLAGTPFNLNSPGQLQEILFGRMKLPILQKTPTGQPSTAEGVLQELAHEHPIAEWIMAYRSFGKLLSTYTRRLPEQINPETGRIHTSWHQLGAATGRLSSSDPNLQNIPVRMQEGRRIREAFVAPPGCQLISADYSQIELRLMAHISDDATLLQTFADAGDIHRATAAEVLGISPGRVTSEERRAAKAINFGLIYGMSAFGLAKQLGTDRQTAQAYIDRYFARYPGVRIYMDTTRQRAREQGYVETLWGRRLYLPDMQARQVMRQKAAERAAINAPLQGSAADIIKRAMISLDRWITDHRSSARIIMQVHDELVLEVPETQVDSMTAVIRQHMMGAASLKVPLEVSTGAGPNWDAASGK